jgi:hypothetical protein
LTYFLILSKMYLAKLLFVKTGKLSLLSNFIY